MNALGKLEKLLLEDKITKEEYLERKDKYIGIVLELYIMGIINKEELQERINQ